MRETNFKMTEVGEIPKDWRVKTIEELFDTGNGYTPSKAIASYWTNGTIPWFRLEDIRINGRILKDSIQHITPEAVKGGRLFPAGSFIISTTATIGEHALLIADSLANQRFSFLIKKLNREKYIDDIFFLYYLYIVGDWCRNNINAGGLLAVSVEDLKQYKCIIPSSLSEQKRIAEVLSDIDALIENLGKFIAKKQAVKQGAMQQLLTGKTRLAGFSEPWVEKRLGDCAIITMGQSPSSIYYNETENGLPLIQGNADIKHRKQLVRIYTSSITKTCEANELIMSVRAPVGSIGKALTKSCIGRGVCSLKVPNDFLYHYLVFIENSWNSISTGSTFDSISGDEIRSTIVFLPSSLSEQQAIATILSDMDSEIAALEAKKVKYEAIKQGAMQQLLTGKIRLV